MLKKFLAYLLILQHLNVYVLHATAGDIYISFARDEEDESSKTLRLQLKREGKSGKIKDIYKGSYKFEDGTFKPCRDTLYDRTGKVKGLTLKSGDSLHIASSFQGHAFNIHLYEDGRAKLQNADSQENHIDLTTFGKVKIPSKGGLVKAHQLSLTGTTIVNEKHLLVDYLNFTATTALGTITNAPEGRIEIGREAHIKQGHFINQGRIIGADQSKLDLHGNDFTNKNISQKERNVSHKTSLPFRAHVAWKGQFSLLNIGEFTNEVDILPLKSKEDCSLRIEAQSLLNKARILANRDLDIFCKKDLINEGKIKGQRRLSFNVDGSLTNRKEIFRSDLLIFNVKGLLLNESGGSIRGKSTIAKTQSLKNEGDIDSELFSLKTNRLENFNKINIRNAGYIEERKGGEGLFNAPGAQLISKGSLEIVGSPLDSEGIFESGGHLEANTLSATLQELNNAGTLEVHEEFSLQGSYKNTGVAHLSKKTNITGEKFNNSGSTDIGALEIVVQVFENIGNLVSTGNIVLEISELFTNAKNSLISAINEIVIKGENKVQNEGQVISTQRIEIRRNKSNSKEEGQRNYPKVKDSSLKSLSTEELLDLQRKADQKDPEGCYKLGKYIYEDEAQKEGAINRERYEIAIRYLQTAADNGYTNAKEYLDKIKRLEENKDDTPEVSKNTSSNEVNTSSRTSQEKSNDFENKGLLASPTIIIETNRGVNTGESQEGVDLSKIEHLKGIVSDSLNVTVRETFSNQGDMVGEKAVELEGKGKVENHKRIDTKGNFTSHLQELDNKGEIVGETLTATGPSIDKDKTDNSTNAFTNTGLFNGSRKVEVEASEVNNQKQVSSKGTLSLTVSKLFTNAVNAVVTAAQDLTVKGEATVQNKGLLGSQKKVDIHSAKTLNEGQILSAEDVMIHTQKIQEIQTDGKVTQDFKNDGLVASPKITLDVANGLNTGESQEGVDLSKIEHLKGIVSDSLSVTVRETFTNQGGMVGEKAVELEGKGKVENHKRISTEGSFTSHLQGLDNKGEIVGETLKVTGPLIDENKTDNSANAFSNTGLFHGSHEVDVEASEVNNQKQVSSEGTLTLTVSKLFTNAVDALVSSVKDLTVKGEGTVQNNGVLGSQEKVDIHSNVTVNEGQILSNKDVVIHTQKAGEEKDFDNKGLVISPTIILDVHKGQNTGETEEETVPSKIEGLKGLISDSLHVTVGDIFINQGDMVGGSVVELKGNGKFENHDTLISNGNFTSQVKDLNNKGDILAEKGTAEGANFTNSGTAKFKEASVLTFDKIETVEDSVLSSEESLTFGFKTLGNRGSIEAHKFATFNGHDFTNEGEVHSEILTVDGTPNIAGTSSESNTFTNKGVFHGSQMVDVKASNVDNEDEVSSEGGLSFKVGKLFINAVGSLVSSIKELTIKGEGEFQNQGHVESQEKIEVETSKAKNQGQMIAEEEIRITTKQEASKQEGEKETKDFENEGLVLSSKITVQAQNGSNEGPINDEVNLDDVDSLKGLIASDSLTLTTGEKFTNKGHMVGGTVVKLEGKGTFENDEHGVVNKTDRIESHMEELDNKGILRAYQSIELDHLGEGLENSGLILSGGTFNVISQSTVTNDGIMEGREGPVTLKAEGLTNRGLLNALGSQLTIDVASGENHHTISGKDGVNLTTKGLFTNADSTSGRIHSDANIKIDGTGQFKNHGHVTSQKDIDVKTNFENKGQVYAAGNILSLTKDKMFSNESGGEVVAEGNVTLKNTKSLVNKGIVQGQETSVTPGSEFTNSGLIAATTGTASFTLQGGTNTGTLSGKTKVDLTLGKKLNNQGHVYSSETVVVHGGGKLQNEETGSLRGGKSLEIKDVELENCGIIASSDRVNLHHLKGIVENKVGGQIVSQGTLDVKDTTTLHNFGDMQGKMSSKVVVSNLQNSGSITSPEGSIDLTIDEGGNGAGGVIAAKTDLNLEL